MENQGPKPKTSEEVDLTQFFQWLGRGVDRIGRAILSNMAAVRNMFFNYIKFFAVVIISGLLIGYVYARLLRKDHYRSTMVVSCIHWNTKILENTIEKLNLLCAGKERSGLAKELGISDSVAKQILGFEYKTFVNENDIIELEVLKEQLNNVASEKKDLVEKILKRLSIENKDAYQISVLVLDRQVLNTLQDALLNYFRTTEYVNRRITINSKIRSDRKQKLVAESKKLDSLKRLIFTHLTTSAQNSRGSNNVILADEGFNNPLDVFREDLRIHQEALELEYALYLEPDFELIDGLTYSNKPDNPSLLKTMLIAFLLSVVLAYIILFWIKFDRLLANYPAKT